MKMNDLLACFVVIVILKKKNYQKTYFYSTKEKKKKMNRGYESLHMKLTKNEISFH